MFWWSQWKVKLKCVPDRLLLLSPDDPSLLDSCVTVIVCSLHIETLKRVPVAL